jgi:hypothetical protein
MNELAIAGAAAPPDNLHAKLRALIATSCQRLASAVNAELTRLYWTVGQRLAAEVLGGEEAPIGMILCAEWSSEQVELLQMHKDGITVAEYWTELPPKAELEWQLHAALYEARERLTRRGVLLEGERYE